MFESVTFLALRFGNQILRAAGSAERSEEYGIMILILLIPLAIIGVRIYLRVLAKEKAEEEAEKLLATWQAISSPNKEEDDLRGREA
jgi:hypothetical protein